MAGDHFPNKYFPDRFFPGTYFQGGEIDPNAMSATITASASLTGSLTAAGDPNAMSASITASASLTGSLVNGAPVVIVPLPSGSTGGGGAARWYIGKYRGEIRRALLRATRKLHGIKPTDGNKKRRKKLRKVAEILRDTPAIAMVENRVTPSAYQPFEAIRIQISTLAVLIEEKTQAAKATAEARQLFARYEAELRRIEREEEEQAIIAVMALLAA